MPLRSHRVRFVVGLALLAGTVFASNRVGIPASLPGIAMGWPLLFHVERGAALASAVGLVVLVLWRGSRGEWPISFGSLFEYAPKESVKLTADALEAQDSRITIIEDALGLERTP